MIEEIAQVLDAIKKMAETEVKCEDKEGEVCVWVGVGVCVGGGGGRRGGLRVMHYQGAGVCVRRGPGQKDGKDRGQVRGQGGRGTLGVLGWDLECWRVARSLPWVGQHCWLESQRVVLQKRIPSIPMPSAARQ